jgi:hypothetical protein
MNCDRKRKANPGLGPFLRVAVILGDIVMKKRLLLTAE